MSRYKTPYDALGLIVQDCFVQAPPTPTVDIGGKNGDAWLSLVFPYGFETWDISLGSGKYRVDKLVDACNMMGIQDNSIGTILSTYALEHFKYPWKFAQHAYRILQKGGLIFVATVFAHEFHPSPQDYWRFSPDGLGVLFEKFITIKKGWIEEVNSSIGVYYFGKK